MNQNRDTHLRDLNAFNVPSDADRVSAAGFDVEQAGTNTPRGKKSPFKKRALNNSSLSDPAPKMAPIAKHSLLAATQEQEPSSVPPSRAPTPEPVDTGIFDEYGVHIPNRVRRGRMQEPNNRAIVQPWIEYDEWDIETEVIAERKKVRKDTSKTNYFYLDQTSFTSLGGGGYKLGTNQDRDFDEELIKLYRLHPVYGIPIKGCINPDNVVPPTDFSKPLDRTRPVVVVDVEETRPKTPGGTRKPAELPEPLELSRSVSLVYADRNFDDFLTRRRTEKLLDGYGAGYPSVKGLATYNAEERDRQRAADGIQDILDAHETIEKNMAKEANAAAAAAAANIAHKSSISAIVNSEDGVVIGGSYINKQKQKSVNIRRGSYGSVSATGLDALNEAIKIRTSQTPGIPPRGFFYGPQARDYGNQPKEYISQGRNMPPPPPQTYIKHPTPMQQQTTVPPQATVPFPQQATPYGAHPQSQQQLHMHQQTAPFSRESPQMLQPRIIAHSPYYNQPPQVQNMGPPARQFNHYVPPQLRQPEQTHAQAIQSSSRPHREIRPYPTQSNLPPNGVEWGSRNTQDAGQSYRNASPSLTYPPQGPYQTPNALAWQQQSPLQQQMQQGLPPVALQQQLPPPPPAQQLQHPYPSHPHTFATAGTEFPPTSVPAHAAATDDYHGEEGSPRKKSTQSKRGKRK